MRGEEVHRSHNRHVINLDKQRSDVRENTHSRSSKDISRHSRKVEELDRKVHASIEKADYRLHNDRHDPHRRVQEDYHDSHRYVREDRQNSHRLAHDDPPNLHRHVHQDRQEAHRHVREDRQDSHRHLHEGRHNSQHKDNRKGENGKPTKPIEDNRQLYRRSENKSQKTNMEREESFEELSRRKRRIESELRSLDQEEAAARVHDAKRKKHTEDVKTRHPKQSDHRSSNSTSHNRPIKFKEEPQSDDERRNRRHPSGSNHASRSRQDSNRNTQRNERPESSNQWGSRSEESRDRPQPKEKEKPNFQTSGKLAEDTNTYNGIVIKYNEPPEARKPKRKWRLYPFKGSEQLPFIPVHKQSAYLLGRTRLIADIPIDHPSCSKQHAILQFRLLPYEREDGRKGKSVRPYILDLDSANGTFVNNKKVSPRCYVELFERDVLKFGFSSRVYVILHEDSKNEDDDEDS